MSPRLGAAGLVAGGIVGFVFHVLYQIGHGPTERNEHGEVLGLTSDEWSRWGIGWTVLLIVGVAALAAADDEQRNRRIIGVVLLGLGLEYAASWMLVFFVPAQLLLTGGRAWLAIDAQRRRLLPAWASGPTLVLMGAWLLQLVGNDFTYDFRLHAGPWAVQYEEVLAFLSALAWVALGLGLLAKRWGPEALRRAEAPLVVRSIG